MRSAIRAPVDRRTIPVGDAGVVTLKVKGRDSGATKTAYEFEMPPTTAGSCIFVPHRVVHTFWNAGHRPVRQLVVFTPGIEDSFDDLTNVLTTEEDVARSVATTAMARQDMVVPPDTRSAYAPLSGSNSPAE